MRSTSMTSPIPTLPSDMLSEITLKLPVVGSTKPWRDLNSLATTCNGLYQWKKSKVDLDVLAEWDEVNKLIPVKNSWIKGLEVIASDYENSPTRLFREPILRKIASKRLDSDLDNQIKDFDLFFTMLFSMLEKISYEDIRQLLGVFSEASLHTKTQIISVLPLFLPALDSKNRQQVLCQLFKLVDNDPGLRFSLATSGAFNKVGNSLGEDHQSKILLMLSLYSRNLVRLGSDKDEFVLDFIRDDVRWSWVMDKVPEYLNTKQGLHTMLDGPVCRKKMITYLEKLFSECVSDYDRFITCQGLVTFYPRIRECGEGKKFVDKLIHWFLRSPEFCIAENGPLHKSFIGLLSKHLAMYKSSLGKKEKDLLIEKISKTISYAIRVKAYHQSTSLLIETATLDKKLITNVCQNSLDLTNKDALVHALLHVNSLKDLNSRYYYVSALCNVARHHRDSDPKFTKAFFDVRNAILMKM